MHTKNTGRTNERAQTLALPLRGWMRRGAGGAAGPGRATSAPAPYVACSPRPPANRSLPSWYCSSSCGVCGWGVWVWGWVGGGGLVGGVGGGVGGWFNGSGWGEGGGTGNGCSPLIGAGKPHQQGKSPSKLPPPSLQGFRAGWAVHWPLAPGLGVRGGHRNCRARFWHLQLLLLEAQRGPNRCSSCPCQPTSAFSSSSSFSLRRCRLGAASSLVRGAAPPSSAPPTRAAATGAAMLLAPRLEARLMAFLTAACGGGRQGALARVGGKRRGEHPARPPLPPRAAAGWDAS